MFRNNVKRERMFRKNIKKNKLPENLIKKCERKKKLLVQANALAMVSWYQLALLILTVHW